jgi:hypothetical protein
MRGTDVMKYSFIKSSTPLFKGIEHTEFVITIEQLLKSKFMSLCSC